MKNHQLIYNIGCGVVKRFQRKHQMARRSVHVECVWKIQEENDSRERNFKKSLARAAAESSSDFILHPSPFILP